MANLANIDMLLSMGLAPKNQLQFGRIVLSDPKQAIKSMVYRDLAASVLGKIANAAINDPIMFQRMRQLLSQGQMNESFDDSTVGLGRKQSSDDTVIHVNPKTLIKAHKATDPDSGHLMSKRVEGIKKHVATGKKLAMPEVTSDGTRVSFINGRHRTNWAADQGHKTIPVSVPKDSVHHVKKVLALHEGNLPGEGTPEAVAFAQAHTPGLGPKIKIIKKLAKDKK